MCIGNSITETSKQLVGDIIWGTIHPQTSKQVHHSVRAMVDMEIWDVIFHLFTDRRW